MGTTAVEEVPVDAQRPLQAAQADQDELVQALSRHAADPPFGMGIGIGRAERRLHDLQACCVQRDVEIMHQQFISVVDRDLGREAEVGDD